MPVPVEASSAVAAQLRKRRPRKNKGQRNQKPWEKVRKRAPKKKDEDVESHTEEEDYSDTQEERKEEYRKGGYHPVSEGELYNHRYRTVHKLGWGYFSTVWLVWDYVDSDFKAMKVQKGAEHYREAALDEIKLLAQIMEGDPKSEKCCCSMTDSFEHTGPNGKHIIMVFLVLGENLLSLITKYDYKGAPLKLVRKIAQQTLIGLDYLHRERQIIHTDLKPENIMLSKPVKKIRRIMDLYQAPPIEKQLLLTEKDPAMMSKAQKKRLKKKLKEQREEEDGDAPAAAPEVTVKPVKIEDDDVSEEAEDVEFERRKSIVIADFGNGCWTYKRFTDEVQTRQYRSPEVILGEEYSTPIDVWSAACVFFELMTGEFLFDPRTGDNFDRDEDHLALCIELLGPLPPRMSRGSGKFRERFLTRHGELRHITNLKYWGLSAVLHEKYNFSRKKADEIANFLLPMLHPDPTQRATAQEMLVNHADWFEEKDDDDSPQQRNAGPQPDFDGEEYDDYENEGSIGSQSESVDEEDLGYDEDHPEDDDFEHRPPRAHSV
eukprot:Rhum_TRINITY_DN14551_c0_g1::Rhum_TRINITY_DN14551_c0_g1_i1::g.95839::m.95839/K08832/SRPK3, STK23; serine/threonine-protein kinase SRPK3